MKPNVLVIIILITMINLNSNGQDKNPVTREPAVAGSFYPANPAQLKSELVSLFAPYTENKPGKSIAALIVPHAGYIFSGEVAASAYSQLDPDMEVETIFLIGTSHQMYLDGASVYDLGPFKTPLGTVQVDLEKAKALIKSSKLFQSVPEAHKREHCLEVQLPFLQYRLNKPFKIVPIIIGTQSAQVCKKIAEALLPYFNEKNFFVISSDFSHYPAYSDANKTDKITGQAISVNSPEKFLKAIKENSGKNISGLATSCCSWTSVLTLLEITSQKSEIEVNHVKYINSGDTKFGDKSRVVGYHSFVFFSNVPLGEGGIKEGLNNLPEINITFTLTNSEKQKLLEIARNSIEKKLKNSSLPEIDESKLSEALKKPCGSFVTLYKNGKLRGCIGRFIATEPLYKIVKEMALAAAFSDTRFEPVEKSELKEIDIEISVLTPLRKIKSIDEFKLGKHGIYMKKGIQSGTFLPKVATDTGWSTEEFLGHCARDKAGIGWDGWKTAELFVYEAYVFGEKDPH